MHTVRVCTDRDCSQQTLRYVSYNDSNEEDDGIKPLVAEDEGNDEERDTEEHSDAGDEVDEMFDLSRYRRLTHLQAGRQVRNASHHCTIAGEYHHAAACT